MSTEVMKILALRDRAKMLKEERVCSQKCTLMSLPGELLQTVAKCIALNGSKDLLSFAQSCKQTTLLSNDTFNEYFVGDAELWALCTFVIDFLLWNDGQNINMLPTTWNYTTLNKFISNRTSRFFKPNIESCDPASHEMQDNLEDASPSVSTEVTGPNTKVSMLLVGSPILSVVVGGNVSISIKNDRSITASIATQTTLRFSVAQGSPPTTQQ